MTSKTAVNAYVRSRSSYCCFCNRKIEGNAVWINAEGIVISKVGKTFLRYFPHRRCLPETRRCKLVVNTLFSLSLYFAFATCLCLYVVLKLNTVKLVLSVELISEFAPVNKVLHSSVLQMEYRNFCASGMRWSGCYVKLF